MSDLNNNEETGSQQKSEPDVKEKWMVGFRKYNSKAKFIINFHRYVIVWSTMANIAIVAQLKRGLISTLYLAKLWTAGNGNVIPLIAISGLKIET